LQGQPHAAPSVQSDGSTPATSGKNAPLLMPCAEGIGKAKRDEASADGELGGAAAFVLPSSSIMAAISVVGWDVGNQSCVIAQAKRGGVDVILNENSKRLTRCVG
jgi:hypothetical protein